MSAQITEAEKAYKFITGGNCRVTLVSQNTGARYTYRVAETDDMPGRYFVSLLTGANNETDFSYIGLLERSAFRTTKASRLTTDSVPCKAFRWAVGQLAIGRFPDALEVWHEGRCGRCNRALTVPSSLDSGFGPECVKMVA